MKSPLVIFAASIALWAVFFVIAFTPFSFADLLSGQQAALLPAALRLLPAEAATNVVEKIMTSDTDLLASDPSWNDQARYLKIDGNGTVELYAAAGFAKEEPWITIAHHPDIGYTCVAGKLDSGNDIDIISCTTFFNNNQTNTPAGTFVNLDQFCIGGSCPFQDSISSIKFVRGENNPNGCPVKGCGITPGRTFRGHIDSGSCGPGAGEDAGYATGDSNFLGCGIDVVSSDGAGGNVCATMAGTATVGHNPWAGNYVTIRNNAGNIITKYNHLLTATVTTGQQVSWGTIVGHQDTTGLAFGSHVHYAVHVEGSGVDPASYGLTPACR